MAYDAEHSSHVLDIMELDGKVLQHEAGRKRLYFATPIELQNTTEGLNSN